MSKGTFIGNSYAEKEVSCYRCYKTIDPYEMRVISRSNRMIGKGRAIHRHLACYTDASGNPIFAFVKTCLRCKSQFVQKSKVQFLCDSCTADTDEGVDH